MKIHARSIFRILAFGLSLTAIGCDEGNGSDSLAEKPTAIHNGAQVTPWASGANHLPEAVLRGTTPIHGCTGSLIAPSWVLTAEHCAFNTGTNNYFQSIRPGTSPGNDDSSCLAQGVTCITRHVDAVINVARSDLTLVHLSQPFTDISPIPINLASEPALLGQQVTCYGFTGTNTMTSGTFTAAPSNTYYTNLSTDDPYFIALPENAMGQYQQKGDSGGPCLLGSQIVAVDSAGPDNDGPGTRVEAATPSSRDVLTTPTQVQFTMGDFNHDGVTDFVATMAAGSTFYVSSPSGYMSATDSTLTLGSVIFTTGYFDNDQKTDLIVTTAAGSSFWYADSTASTIAFTPFAAPSGLTYNVVQFTTADFNNDGYADYIATTPLGSTWYYGTSTRGSFISGYARPDLKVQTVDFAYGNFDNDSYPDLIVTTPNGTQWLYGNTAQTWPAAPSTNRDDLPLGGAAFTVGDFDGDSHSDMVITTPLGSYWYFAKTAGRNGWDNLYTRGDLTLGAVKFIPGNFNGDTKTDLAVVTSSGSYWYLSTGRGTFDSTTYASRSDLPLGAVQYSMGNFVPDSPIQKTDMLVTTPYATFMYKSTGAGGAGFTDLGNDPSEHL